MNIRSEDLSPLNEATDYEILHLENQIIEENKMFEKKLERLLFEAKYRMIYDGYSEVVTEGFIDAIKEFFKKILDMFREKMGINSKAQLEWLEYNRPSFEKIKYDNMTISVFPYWKCSPNDMSNICNTILLDIKKSLETNPNQELVDVINNTSSGKKYKDINDDLKKGLYNYFRTGDSKKLMAVTIKGGEVKNKVDVFIKYIENYKNSYTTLKSLQDTMLQTIANMSFATMNDNVSKESSLMMEALNIFFEADEGKRNDGPTKQEKEKTKEADKEAKAANGEVQNGDTTNKPKEGGEKPAKVNYNGLRGNLKSLATTMFGTALTAIEEADLKYFQLLKDILSAGGVQVVNPKKKAKEDAEAKVTNEEPKKEKKKKKKK